MGELLGFFGVVLGLWFLISPAVTLVTVLRSRRRVEELEGRVISLERELAVLRLRPPSVAKQLPIPQRETLPLPPERETLPLPLPSQRETLPAGSQREALLLVPPPELPLPIEPLAPPTSEFQLPDIRLDRPPQPSESAATPKRAPSISDEPTTAEPVQTPPEPIAAPLPPPAALPPPATLQPQEQASPPADSPGAVFDLEKLLGVRGAAWLGAIALAIAGTLFAKYSIENNLIPPSLRIALLIVLGVGALIASEWPLRPRYTPTANSVAGAGIAVLYSAFYAGHSLYSLFDTKVTFALMILTTVVAALMSLRYSAMFIAGLGLVGGFATPVLLSANQDRPIALFLYVLLLDVGFLAMAVRRGWHALSLLSLLLTLGIEGGWLAKRLAPEKLSIGIGAATLFALLYLALPSVARRFGPKEKDGAPQLSNQTLLLIGTVGGMAPFLLALYLAGESSYLPQWPLLHGFVACLNAGLLVVTLLRREATLLVAGVVATVVVQNMATLKMQAPASLWALSLSTLGIYILPNLAGRLDRGLDRLLQRDALPKSELPPRDLFEAAGLIAVGGLCIYVTTLLSRVGNGSPWLFWTLFAALFALIAERGRTDGVRFVMPLGGLVLGSLVLWRVVAATEGRDPLSSLGPLVPREFAAQVLLAVAFGALSSWRGLRASVIHPVDPSLQNAKQTELAGIIAVLLGHLGLFYSLSSAQLSGSPWPLLVCLVIYNVLLFCAALRQNYTSLLPLSLTASALLVSIWHGQHFQTGDIGYALLVYGGFGLSFLAAPLGLVYRNRRAWQGWRGPYLTSALAGPFFFYVVCDAVIRTVGKGAIGLLPLCYAALAVLGLVAVQRLPKMAPEWLDKDVAARRLLGNRALFSAVALAFITLAVPLQLDRQWVIVAWALEAAAVMRLFQLLPHPGLKYFGVALFALVTFRLLLDKDVLHMQARGLVIVNWLLYTYGVPAACFIIGGIWLRAVEVEKHDPWERQLYGAKPRLASAISFLGVILCFALINLEIADGFSKGRFVEFSWERDYARDLVTSVAWALYAVALLLVGMWRQNRALRFVSLGFLVLTIAKVFLLDLSNLRGVYRPLSFLGLAASLILVSLLYQRFVFQKDKKGSADDR